MTGCLGRVKSPLAVQFVLTVVHSLGIALVPRSLPRPLEPKKKVFFLFSFSLSHADFLCAAGSRSERQVGQRSGPLPGFSRVPAEAG